MELKTPLTLEQRLHLRQQERVILEKLTDPAKAIQIEALVMAGNIDGLQSAFEAIPYLEKRLRATAYAERMSDDVNFQVGLRLGGIARSALWAIQKKYTPMGEKAAVALCIDIFRGNEQLGVHYVENALIESLLLRLESPDKPGSMGMNRAVQKESKKILRDYFMLRKTRYTDRALWKKLHAACHEGDDAPPAPVRADTGGTVIMVDFRNRSKGPA